ncbi:nucleosome assembly protein [Aspergillus avenaceus]|uniref:Nucleosome assembly protein n=1 Tax=Aspergillus avenaceus TaxID=36643 RepID=A0A5N6TL19_ASPAV|nr:nucleosome assembly protein [Aspergillus avenaceus]
MAPQIPSFDHRLEENQPTDAQESKLLFLEEKRVRIENEILRRSILEMRDWYKERDAFIKESEQFKDDFWIRVFASAPAEIDQYVTTPDASALGSALKSMNVERFELNEKGEGEPRSIRLTFEFFTGEQNPFFENDKLVKEFYWRKRSVQTDDGRVKSWEGLVSEPVRIQWKKDMDLTKGLLDAACDLAEAEKKGGDRHDLPEFDILGNKVVELEAAGMENDEEDLDFPSSPVGVSFFGFFGYRGNDITAEESAAVTKKEEERFARRSKGEQVDEEEEEVDEDFEGIEVYPDGEKLAVALADVLWNQALSLFNNSLEAGSDLELEMEDLEDDEEDEEDEQEQRPKKKVKA